MKTIYASILTLALLLSGQPVLASDNEGTLFKRIPTQFIAALGDPLARSGDGAEQWGLWTVDPGPRGVRLAYFELMLAEPRELVLHRIRPVARHDVENQIGFARAEPSRHPAP